MMNINRFGKKRGASAAAKWGVLIVSFFCPTTWADSATSQPSAPPNVDPSLWQQMVEVNARSESVTDLVAHFEQRKFTAMLKKPLVSSGTVRIAGAVMLCDTTEPQATSMRIDEHDVQLYYPQQKTVEIYPIAGRLGSLAGSPLPRLSVLREYFAFEEANVRKKWREADEKQTLALKLTPSDASLRKHVDHVLVLLDRQTGTILKSEVTDVDGDRTEMTFSEAKTNTGLSSDDVRLNLPSDVTLTRPLEGAGASTQPDRSP